MKITGSCHVTGRGHALFTDEPWSISTEQRASAKKKIRVADEEFDINGLGSALGPDRVRYLTVIVPTITEQRIEEFIQNREAQLR
jgi:hypothetical protein